jgi:long-chain acyl-CoA synthetase
LISLGFPRGGKVAILGFNRPEWVVFDHASMMAGGVPAGIYTTCSPEEVQYIVHHSEAFVVLVEDVAQWKKLAAQRANLPLMRHGVTMKGCPPIDDPLVLSWRRSWPRAPPPPRPSSTSASTPSSRTSWRP